LWDVLTAVGGWAKSYVQAAVADALEWKGQVVCDMNPVFEGLST